MTAHTLYPFVDSQGIALRETSARRPSPDRARRGYNGYVRAAGTAGRARTRSPKAVHENRTNVRAAAQTTAHISPRNARLLFPTRSVLPWDATEPMPRRQSGCP